MHLERRESPRIAGRARFPADEDLGFSRIADRPDGLPFNFLSALPFILSGLKPEWVN
jgi:hypothetical protein